MESRKMKKILFPIISFILLLPVLTFASVGKPQGLTLSPGVTTLTVSWTLNSTDDTDGYYVSWGTSASALDTRHTINSTSTNTYIITGLSPDTTYHVRVTAFDTNGNEETPSDSKSETTKKDLALPLNFNITSLKDITESSISVIWEHPIMYDLAGYRIYYKITKDGQPSTKDVNTSTNTATLNALESGKRYYISITSLNTSKDESAHSDELIVDTKPDQLGPNMPTKPDVQLTGEGIITITINDTANKGMVDLKEYKVRITDNRSASDGTVLEAGLNPSINVGPGTANEEIVFENGVTYTITVTAFDQDDKESEASPPTSITIQDPQNILIDSDEVESGCFVGVLKKDSAGLLMTLLFCALFFVVVLLNDRGKGRTLLILPLLLIVSEGSARSEMNNTIGIKAGYFKMSDPLMKETFEDRFPVPVRLYYDRTLYKDFHADIDAGFLKLEGKRITDSGEKTGAQNTFYFMPVSVSFTYNHYLTPIFYAYIGTGLDHWYVREEIENMDANEKQSHYVAGYHYKCGIAYLAKDADIYQKYGIQLETVYAIIDRFGRNDRDLGGFTLQAGYFYRF